MSAPTNAAHHDLPAPLHPGLVRPDISAFLPSERIRPTTRPGSSRHRARQASPTDPPVTGTHSSRRARPHRPTISAATRNVSRRLACPRSCLARVNAALFRLSFPAAHHSDPPRLGSFPTTPIQPSRTQTTATTHVGARHRDPSHCDYSSRPPTPLSKLTTSPTSRPPNSPRPHSTTRADAMPTLSRPFRPPNSVRRYPHRLPTAARNGSSQPARPQPSRTALPRSRARPSKSSRLDFPSGIPSLQISPTTPLNSTSANPDRLTQPCLWPAISHPLPANPHRRTNPQRPHSVLFTSHPTDQCPSPLTESGARLASPPSPERLQPSPSRLLQPRPRAHLTTASHTDQSSPFPPSRTQSIRPPFPRRILPDQPKATPRVASAPLQSDFPCPRRPCPTKSSRRPIVRPTLVDLHQLRFWAPLAFPHRQAVPSPAMSSHTQPTTHPPRFLSTPCRPIRPGLPASAQFAPSRPSVPRLFPLSKPTTQPRSDLLRVISALSDKKGGLAITTHHIARTRQHSPTVQLKGEAGGNERADHTDQRLRR